MRGEAAFFLVMFLFIFFFTGEPDLHQIILDKIAEE